MRTWLKWIGLKEGKDLRGQSLGNSHLNAEAAKKSAGSSDREKDVGPQDAVISDEGGVRRISVDEHHKQD